MGYGGKTINTLRLWAAAAPDSFDFQAFSHGEFVSAMAGTLAAESLTRVLYPDDSTTHGQALRFVQEYFLVACSLADLVRRFRRSNADWNALPAATPAAVRSTLKQCLQKDPKRRIRDIGDARLSLEGAFVPQAAHVHDRRTLVRPAVIAAAGVAVALRKAREELDERTAPLAASMAYRSWLKFDSIRYPRRERSSADQPWMLK